jgi:hypothetical protein
MPISPNPNREQQIGQYATLLDQAFPPSRGTDYGHLYITYMHAHPALAPATVYAETVTALNNAKAQLGQLPSAIGSVGNNLGKIMNQFGTGTALGLGQVTKDLTPGAGWAGLLTFLGDLTNPHTWLRVAEFLVGGILIGIGLNAILKQSTGVDVAGSAVKVAKKVAK